MSRKYGFERYEELHERVLEALPALGFRRPTQVQERVIPNFFQRRSLLVEAPTGTGKTAAYGLPLISRLNLLKRSTQALVLVPSRELALQVSQALQSYFVGNQLVVGAVYGGVPMSESLAAIKAHPHILVVVPGRLKDVTAHQPYDFLWRDIKYLIVDEGDKLMESGFQRDFDSIRMHLRGKIQVGVFSATISQDSEQMLRERFPQIQTIRLSPREMLKNIRFHYAKSKKGKRESYLLGLIEQYEVRKALIFCTQRSDIFALTRFLRKMAYRTEAYYGNQEQHERQNILRRFKEGKIDYLVASDLAARGLDVPNLPAVINLVIPQTFDYYLHRVGRTGRAGSKGKVYNLVSSEVEFHYLKNHHELIGLRQDRLDLKPVDPGQLKADEGEHWVKYHFSRGKRDKIRKGDLVGYLINQAELQEDQIGTISLYEAYSVVDMPQKAYDRLMALNPLPKLKGKSVKIRPFQLAEQVRKAQSVRKLKADRR